MELQLNYWNELPSFEVMIMEEEEMDSVETEDQISIEMVLQLLLLPTVQLSVADLLILPPVLPSVVELLSLLLEDELLLVSLEVEPPLLV